MYQLSYKNGSPYCNNIDNYFSAYRFNLAFKMWIKNDFTFFSIYAYRKLYSRNKQKSGFKSLGLACTGKVHSLYLTEYDFINCETDF